MKEPLQDLAAHRAEQLVGAAAHLRGVGAAQGLHDPCSTRLLHALPGPPGVVPVVCCKHEGISISTDDSTTTRAQAMPNCSTGGVLVERGMCAGRAVGQQLLMIGTHRSIPICAASHGNNTHPAPSCGMPAAKAGSLQPSVYRSMGVKGYCQPAQGSRSANTFGLLTTGQPELQLHTEEINLSV